MMLRMEEDQEGASSDGKEDGPLHGFLLGWGSGEFAQHGHGMTAEDIDIVTADVIGYPALWDSLKDVSCGSSHTAVITDRFESYTWGNSNSGQLGCGDKGTHALPQKVLIPSTNSSLVGVACGGRHTIWWTENGRCYSSGNNFYAQLGYDFRVPNYKENQVRPQLLRPLLHHRVVQVACGEKHSLFLFETGLLSGCGCSDSGQLGSGTREEVLSPKLIEDLDEEIITAIACGPSHSLAVTNAGQLYVWGSGRACGSRNTDGLSPMQKRTKHSNIVSVAGGSSHSMALSASGSVYTWGGGSDGQLGFGKTSTYLAEPRCLPKSAFKGPVSQIACGESYSAAVTVSGQLYLWGKNSHVIPDSKERLSHFHPSPVECQHPVSKLACGAWHAAAVTGYPQWQPLMEESSDEDLLESEGEEEEEEEDEDGQLIDCMKELESQSDFDKSSPKHMKNPRSKKFGLPSKSALSLSLAEFYAPTPLPAIRPISQLTERKLSLQSCESAIMVSQESAEQTNELSHQEKDTLPLSKTESDETKNNAGGFESHSNDVSEVQYSRSNSNFQNDKMLNSELEFVRGGDAEATTKKKLSGKEAKGRVFEINHNVGKVSSAKVPRKEGAVGGSLVRAKSLPVFHKQSKSNLTVRQKGENRGRKKSNQKKGSFTVQQEKKPKVSLNSTDIFLEYQTAQRDDVNRMPVPKMTRAHTYYGKMSSKPPSSKTSKYVSSPSRVGDDKSRTYFEGVVRGNTHIQFSPKVGKNSKPGGGGEGVRSAIAPPPQRRAMYSSASSWRNGDQRGKDVLLSNQKKLGREDR